MKAFEFLNYELLPDINGKTSFLDLAYLAEAELEGKTVNENDVIYLNGIDSDVPVIGKEYYVGFVMCFPDSRITLHGSKSIVKVLSKRTEGDLLVYRCSNGQEYPAYRITPLSVMKSFFFTSREDFNHFLSTLAIKFTTTTRLSEARIKSYKQATTNRAPIRTVSDIFRSSTGKDFAGVNFDALRHNAKLDQKDVEKFGSDFDKRDNKRMQRVGLLRLKNLFNPSHPDYKIEQSWFNSMSPEQQRAELRQHSKDEIERWKKRNEGK